MSEKKVCPFCGSDKIENHRYNTDDKGFIWYDHFVCLTCGKEGFEPSDRKRKTTEDIVPPFELCKRLPEGAFADSVLVHVVKPGSGTEVRERIKADTLPLSWTKVPAPTIKEMLEELARMDTCPRLDMLVAAATGKVIYTLTYGTWQEQGDNPEVMILNVLLKLKEEL